MLLSPPAGATRINLTFHGIGRPPRPLADGEASVWVTRSALHAALDVVRERPEVRITFDDSNRSDLELALPALRERGLRATFFVLAGRLDDPAHLSALDVRTLLREGMEIGSHGMDHLDWRAAAASPAALERELGSARRRLEEICGRPVLEAAIPFGRYDRRVLAGLRRCGYAHVYTSDGGPTQPAAWLQPRNTLRAGDGLPELARILDGSGSAGPRAVRDAKRAVKRWR